MLAEKILNQIDFLWRIQRMTQLEIGKKLNVPQTQISAILSGKRKTGGLRIETFDKMFPNAIIHLDGECPGKGSVNTTGNHNIVNSAVSATHEAMLDGILSDIMASPDISADDKVAVYNIISAHKG